MNGVSALVTLRLVRRGGATGGRPTLLSLGGGDSLAEELYFWGGGAAALRRGYNALLFEIPGQRGAMYSNPDAGLFYRPDSEVPLKSFATGRSVVRMWIRSALP
jgi:hypothetical protein